MDRQCQTLQTNRQRTNLLHLGVSASKSGNNRVGKDSSDKCHDTCADQGDDGGEAIALTHAVIAFCAPVKASNGLEATAEAEDDTEREHHNLGGDTDASENGVGDIASEVVEHDTSDHGEQRTEHRGRADTNNLHQDIRRGTAVTDRQV